MLLIAFRLPAGALQGGYDDLVADYHFHINDVVKQGEITPHWICL